GAGREVLRRRSGFVPMADPGLSRKQALAAIGQVHLISRYSEVLAASGIHIAQLLFSARDFRDRRAYLNIGHTLNELLALDVVPVINENDTVSTEELKFGDNDMLSAACAGLFHADCLIILTTVEGFLVDGKRMGLVEHANRDLLRHAGGPTGPGSGGMRTKMEAGRLGQRVGHFTAILPGRHERPVQALFEGEDLGTLVPPLEAAQQMAARKKWILYVPGEGKLRVDAGARRALLERGASLLSAGVVACEGQFRQGDVVEILDSDDSVLARGLSSIPSSELTDLIGADKTESREAVHRDNLILDPH
ncbi:MAG: glutamate 5-kinase, partial [Leptospiraceae bacterium]|nr:glutamate 5-kinase [Leptospiraceae bacterium]